MCYYKPSHLFGEINKSVFIPQTSEILIPHQGNFSLQYIRIQKATIDQNGEQWIPES